jgi:hypothetical protein
MRFKSHKVKHFPWLFQQIRVRAQSNNVECHGNVLKAKVKVGFQPCPVSTLFSSSPFSPFSHRRQGFDLGPEVNPRVVYFLSTKVQRWDIS